MNLGPDVFQEQGTTNDKNRMIMDHVRRRGEQGYMTFKKCLEMSQHAHLVDLLKTLEKKFKAPKKPKSVGKKNTTGIYMYL